MPPLGTNIYSTPDNMCSSPLVWRGLAAHAGRPCRARYPPIVRALLAQQSNVSTLSAPTFDKLFGVQKSGQISELLKVSKNSVKIHVERCTDSNILAVARKIVKYGSPCLQTQDTSTQTSPLSHNSRADDSGFAAACLPLGCFPERSPGRKGYAW